MAGKLSPVFAQDKRVLFAYLFGSVLRRKDARDIDLAVCLAQNGDAWKTIQSIAARIEKTLGYSAQVDAHAFNDAAPGFVFEILSSGRLLYERDPDQRLDWEAHAVSKYQDIRPMLEFYDRDFLKR
ncbi:MAG: nucleotidyltransferase domain-containing protein [candidate division NC10 bacterium]